MPRIPAPECHQGSAAVNGHCVLAPLTAASPGGDRSAGTQGQLLAAPEVLHRSDKMSAQIGQNVLSDRTKCPITIIVITDLFQIVYQNSPEQMFGSMGIIGGGECSEKLGKITNGRNPARRSDGSGQDSVCGHH